MLKQDKPSLLAFLAGWDSVGKEGPAPQIYIQADNKLFFKFEVCTTPWYENNIAVLLTSVELF